MISLMRLLRFLAVWLFWPGVALIAWGELTPNPPALTQHIWDKAEHFTAYFGLAVLAGSGFALIDLMGLVVEAAGLPELLQWAVAGLFAASACGTVLIVSTRPA